MLVHLTKFAGVSLAISGIEATVLNPGAMPSAQPIFIGQAQADQVYSGTYNVDLRNVAVQVKITDYANRYALMAQLKTIFKRGRRGDLEATFTDDDENYRLDCVVVSPPVQIQDFPQYFTIILQTGDSAWLAVDQEVFPWEVSGAGETQEITVAGNDETRLSLDIIPTTGPAAGFLYKKLYRLVNVPARNFGVRPWCLTIDHAALVTALKSQTDGYDLRIWLGDVETKRWIEAPDTSATKIWFNIPIPAGFSLRLLTAIAGAGSISTMQFERTATVKTAITAMPSKGIVYEGNEWFYYGAKDPANYRLLSITRGLYGTTVEAHSAADSFKFIGQPIFLLYGNMTIGDPADDDDHYDDDKPVFKLSSSSNTEWVYDDTTDFFDPAHPTRPGSWTKNTITRNALNAGTYLYDVEGDAESGDPVLGARAANFKSGSTWKADNITLGWQLYCAAGFQDVTATGRKYRASTQWPATAGFQRSTNGVTWFSLWTEASPSAAATFEAWAAHTNITAGGYPYIRQVFAGAFAASPNDSYALLEGLTVTVEFISAFLPAEALGGEEDNAQLAATIENLTNGDKILIDLPMKVDVPLDLDGENNIVLFDGVHAARSLSLDDESRSVWIRLQPGVNEISITGDDLGTLDVNLKHYVRRLH